MNQASFSSLVVPVLPAIGVSDADGRPVGVSPEADRAIRTGTGGLY